MCEQKDMADKPGTMELAGAIGISKGYASDILNDENERKPSRALAIHIFRKTGWRHSVIADLTDEQIDLLEQVDPWTRAA